jgi:large subunit ribosomal protein L25
MTKYTLKAEKRTMLGKKINRLRKEGLLPANLFGKNIPSQAIQVKTKDFERLYKEAGETGIIYIQVDDESKERPTLVSGLAYNPVTGLKYHVDFHQVNLKEKVVTHVPIEIIGECELIKSGAASLVTSLDEIEIEALPTDIPESVTLDISSFKEMSDHFKVSDIKLSAGVEIKTDPEITIVSLSEPEKEEVKVVEEAPTEAAAPETPGTEKEAGSKE